MSEFELEGLMALDAGEYVSGVDDAVDASGDLVNSTDATGQSLFDLDPAGIAAGGALVGVGAAAQSLLDDTQELRETLGRTGVSMGITTDEANALARSMSDATFPVDDVVSSMDALAQIGVDSEEQMREVALAADALADATGTSATEISQQLAPAVQALDGDLSALADDADAFTNAVRDTGLEMSDVASTIERLDFSQIEQMGLSAADTADLIGRFGRESGFTGRQLRTEFRSAVEEADGDTAALVDELGLGEEAMASLADETAAGTSMTDEYANAANDSLTTMDSLRSSFDDIRLQASGMLGPLDAAAPAMQGLGIAAIALSTINFGAVIPSITGVVAASAPLLPILLPLAGLIAGFGALWHSGWIDPVETVTWLAEEAGERIDWLSGHIRTAIDMVNRFYPPIRIAREVWDRNLFGIQDTTSAVIGHITDSIDWLISKINSIPGMNIGGEDVEETAGDIDDADGGSAAGPMDADTMMAGDGPAVAAPEETDPDVANAAAVEDPPDAERSTSRTRPPADTDDTNIASEIRDALSGLSVIVETGDEALDQLIREEAQLVVDAENRKQKRRADARNVRPS